ncbi:MAG: hypothetical protein ACOYOU_15135 [Kiritimatiellia bacterium]
MNALSAICLSGAALGICLLIALAFIRDAAVVVYLSKIGRIGGESTSAAKQSASRASGKKTKAAKLAAIEAGVSSKGIQKG